MVDNKTANLQLPLPDLANYTRDDIPRLIQALKLIDNLLATKEQVNTKADATETASAINLKADTQAVIDALATKALLAGSGSQPFSVATATAAEHAVRLQLLLDRAGSAGALMFRNRAEDGALNFWYEGTSQTGSGYGSDTMWRNDATGTTKTHTQQKLTPGVDLPCLDAPSLVYFSRTVVTSVAGANNYAVKYQNIDDVRTLAGKQVMLSFYAKSDATKNIAVAFSQCFGSGGSTTVRVTSQLVALSSTWHRYSVQVTLPSIAGKTIGTDSYLQFGFWFDAGSSAVATYSIANVGQQSGTFDIAGVQLEEGTAATPFEELPIEVSKQRVDRYYELISVNGPSFSNINNELNVALIYSEKRTTPVASIQAGTIRARTASGSTNTATINQLNIIGYSVTTCGAVGMVTTTGATITPDTNYSIYTASKVKVDARL